MSSGQVHETGLSAHLRAAKRLSDGRSSVVSSISGTTDSESVNNDARGHRENSGNPRTRSMTLTVIKNSNQKNMLTSISNLKNGTNQKLGEKVEKHPEEHGWRCLSAKTGRHVEAE